MLKIAIIGCGLVASKKHIPAFLRLKDKIEIVAVCDLNTDLANSLAKKFGINKIYSDLAEMLLCEKPDVVSICTPPQTHAKLSVQALEGGAHVLLEKPMALKLSDCDLMNDASTKYNKTLSVMHNQMFNPAFIKGRNLFNSGEIGELLGINIFLSTPTSYMTSIKDHWAHKLPGGVLGETGPHSVYLASTFINNISDVDIHAKKILKEYPWSNFEDFRIQLIGNNAIGSITQIYSSNQWAANIELFGSMGMLKIDLEGQTVVKYNRTKLNASIVGLSILSNISQLTKYMTSNTLNYILGKRYDAHAVGIREYIDCLIEGRPFMVSGKEGRENVHIMEMLVNKLNNKYKELITLR